MKNFEYSRAGSFEEASQLIKEGARPLAGGTDLLGELKDDILPEYPKELVDIKRIPDGDDIRVEDGFLKIGALAKLSRVAEDTQVNTHMPMLAEAAASVATPLIRNLGTIGGNLCQDVRCWFYRYPQEAGGRLVCSRKGGCTCYDPQGDSRYHSIFGGMKAHLTPCAAKCPAGTDIPAYMEQIRKGNIDAAASIIMQVNPMPMITSRVCAHFCQEDCNRCANDEGVAIGNVERYVGDYILENSERFYQPPARETGKSAAVIGAGPSGLAAAYYLRRSGNQVTVYDAKKEPGGMLMYAIPNYRLPKDLVRRFTACLTRMGIRFVHETVIGKDLAPEQLEKEFDTVYYATGAWKRPVLGLAGEELTVFGLDFLIEVNEWMKGKVGEEVLVTGGGNVAMDVAITAKRLGAKKVTMACLEPENEMPASREEIARAKEEGIEILPSWGLGKVIEENGVVKGMELKRCVSVRDASGAFNPSYNEKERMTVRAENILMAVGQRVDLSFLSEKYQMALTKRGLIDVAEDTQMTSREGVFAGGDAATGPATVIRGIAAGHNAARGMNRYLGVAEPAASETSDQSPFLTFDPQGIKKENSARLEELPAAERSIDKEDSKSLSEEKAREEAARCLNCGCYAVHPSDIAPVLVTADAQIVTTLRQLSAEEFFCAQLKTSDVLKPGELVKEIRIPLNDGAVTGYEKFRLRNSVDFAIVSLASLYRVEGGKIMDARVVFGGVAPIPLRNREVEQYLIGKPADEAAAEEAARLSAAHAIPFEKNAYKVRELETLMRESVRKLANT